MTEQSGSTTSFSSGPQRGSTTIDSISHESIFCPTRAGDIFLFCRRQSRCCCTLSVGTHTTPWVSSLVALMAQDAQPRAKNPLIQCTYPENTLWIEELFPQLWVNRPCPSICPHSAKQAVRLCLKWTMCWRVFLTDSSLQLQDQQSTFCHPAAQRGVLGSGEQRLH